MLHKQNLFGGGSTNAGGDRYRRDNPQSPSSAPQANPLLQPGASTATADAAKSAAPAETAKPNKAATPEESRGSRLIVGPDIKLKGAEITDCDTLACTSNASVALIN